MKDVSLRWRRAWSIGCLCLLTACATSPPTNSPVLRLAPAALGQELAAHQQLHVQTREHEFRMEVLLEVDAQAVDLALLDLGQVVARLRWDGIRLNSTSIPGLPATISAERILSDLQLTYWPVAAIAQTLPTDWTIEDDGLTRVLRQLGQTVVEITQKSPTRIRLAHEREGYVLIIDSQFLSDAP